MERLISYTMILMLSLSLYGCGSDNSPAASDIEQDELSQWVNENPAPEAVPLDED